MELQKTFEYNYQGLPLKIVTNGVQQIFTYDENGNRLQKIDSQGNTTQSQYDANNRLTSKKRTLWNRCELPV